MAQALQTVAGAQSLGQSLRECREARNLRVRDVAAQMHLDPAIIEALEADEFDRLPDALYVRGYLRGYAKILHLDPAALITRYDGSAPREPPEIVPEISHPSQARSSDRPVKLFTYLVTLTLALLLVAWWQSNFVLRGGSGTETMRQPASGAPPPGLPYPIRVVKHPDTPFYRAPAEVEAAGPADERAAPPPESVEGPGGPDRVELQLSADSWIEIFDARNRKVHVGLAHAGDVLHLAGQAPFSVLLGYAPAVSIEFNGKPFDSAPYTRSGSGIARFTLGE